jgi:hypothetical protein
MRTCLQLYGTHLHPLQTTFALCLLTFHQVVLQMRAMSLLDLG